MAVTDIRQPISMQTLKFGLCVGGELWGPQCSVEQEGCTDEEPSSDTAMRPPVFWRYLPYFARIKKNLTIKFREVFYVGQDA